MLFAQERGRTLGATTANESQMVSNDSNSLSQAHHPEARDSLAGSVVARQSLQRTEPRDVLDLFLQRKNKDMGIAEYFIVRIYINCVRQ